jgi:glycosyltransferase involved in cell wall biosynthesis
MTGLQPATPRLSLLVLGEGWFPDSAGGARRFVRELDAALRPLLDVTTIVLGPALDPPPGVRVAGDVRDPLFRRVRSYSRAARDAARDADLVESHFALYAFLPLFARRLRRLPLVVHFHGPWAAESLAMGERSRLRLAAKKAVELSVYRRASEVIVHSHAFKRVLVESYGLRPWNVHVLPPGVDLHRFTVGDRRAARSRLDLPQAGKVVATVRRLVPRMGIDVLLEACTRLDAETAQDLIVLIGGDGPERARLEALARRLGLAAHVRFLGRVSETELADAYRAADVSVVPSTALEGFGLVVLEALACGTPVVASDVGGLGEALVDLDPSLIVPPGDADQLASHLRRALSTPTSLPTSAACRAHAERFAWPAAAEQHKEVYERARGVTPAARKPRIVFLDHCARLSGGELALLRLVRGLGHEVDAHVILGEDGPLAAKLRLAGISSEVLEMPQAARDVRRQLVTFRHAPVREALMAGAYALRLAMHLRRLRPDLVHANSLKSLVYGGLAARLAGVPVVWHVRDRIADDYLPHGAVALVGRLARVVPRGIIANSCETLGQLENASAGATGRLPHAVIYDPVDLEPAAVRRRERPLRIGMLGRIAPWKGQHLFLQAFADAFAHGAERASIVGAPLFGEERYEADLRRLAQTLGVADRVEFAGFREDVGAELARLDVLVHASLLPEPLGQVIQEGMRAGLPVVAARGGGPSELIADGRDGFLYPSGDAQALGRTLTTLAVDPALRARVGAAAGRRARAFEPERVAPQVLDLYRQVLSR